MIAFLNKKFEPLQLFWLFVVFCMLFVMPLILADTLYLDDYQRAQLAQGNWLAEGRIMHSLLYGLLSFTSGAPNIFPLPLLLSTLVVAAALARLTRHYFNEPRFCQALVVLPLWYSPFFLQNLSYQYDGPGMALGLSAMVYALTYRTAVRWMQLLVPSVLIAVSLSFYQLFIALLLGLYGVELLHAAQSQWPPAAWYRLLKEKACHVAAGLAIYAATAWPWLAANTRSSTLPLNRETAVELARRLREALGLLGVLVNDGNRWLFVLMTGAALFWFCVLGWRILRSVEPLKQRLAVFLLYLLSAPLLVLMVAGPSLIFVDYLPSARVMIGLAPLLLAVFYLTHCALQRFGPRASLLLCLALACMLSFSFAYGRVLQVQRVQTERIALELSMDIASHPEIDRLETLYLSGAWGSERWLPGSDGAFQRVPALKFVLGYFSWTLPEVLARYGVVNMSWPRETDSALYRPIGAPLVTNHFYSIYVDGNAGYVIMQPPQTSRHWVPDR